MRPPPARKRETHDALGRLVSVTENAGLHPGDGIQGEVTTTYTYDIGGRLSGVSMPSAAGTQTRSFLYDNRGLLRQETHPEIGLNGNGTTLYSQHDARGHVGRKTIGTLIDLRYDYDAAERLIQVKDGKESERPLALFSFDCIRFDVTQPCASATHPGQLAASARYNHDSELGTIAVTQANQYDPLTGRLVRRDCAVGSGEVGGVPRFTGESFFFTQSFNDLGLPATLTYPCRVSGAGCLSGDPGRAVPHALTTLPVTKGDIPAMLQFLRTPTGEAVDGWAAWISYWENRIEAERRAEVADDPFYSL